MINENKKGVRAVKHSVKPRNPVAKNAMAGIGGGAAGAHKDKKKAAKQGDVKHKKKVYDVAEEQENPSDEQRRLNKRSDESSSPSPTPKWSKGQAAKRAQNKKDLAKSQMQKKKEKQGVAEGKITSYDLKLARMLNEAKKQLKN